MKRHFRLISALVLALALLSGVCSAAKPHYLPPASLNLEAVLPAPPANDSAQTKAELAELLQLQQTRTPEMVASAQADADRSPFRFADVLGPEFTQANLPEVAAMFAAILEDVRLQTRPVKKHWNRPRPFRLDPQIVPCVPRPSGPSFPSAHSTFGHLTAELLALMVPEKAAQLRARGESYAHNRLVGGVHYPSDVAGGALAAKTMGEALLKDPKFMTDFDQAKAHVRSVLGLDK